MKADGYFNMIFDSHCHIQFQGYKDDREEVIFRCAQKEVLMNAVGTQKDTSKKAVELAEQHDNIYATIGLHPVHLFSTHVDEEESNFISREEDFDEDYYSELAKSEKVIAVGECGLELYHLSKDADKNKILEKQKNIFIKQYNFAQKHSLPIVIHVREAYSEMAEVLQSLGTSHNGVVHCYSGNWAQAEKFLNMGLYLGFTGVITFPPRKTDPKPTLDLLEVIKNCPLDRILIETDAPYLAPQAYRGQRCEPWMVEEVVKKIAEVKNKTEEEIKKITFNNTARLFRNIKNSA